MNHRITARDIEVFKKLIECRAMSTPQIHTLFFGGPSPSRCIMRLKFLYDIGYLRRIEQPSLLSEGKKPYIYTLTRPALQLIEQEEIETKELTAGYPFLSHILDIAEVNVHFTVASKQVNFIFDSWLNELTLKRRGMIDRFEIETPAKVRHMAAIVPDATFVITAERPYRFLLEVDKGTETLKDIELKMVKYRHYFEPGEENGPSIYAQRYGISGGRVLFVAPSPLRLQNMKTICEKSGGLSRYWFTTLDDIEATNPLTVPIWRKAGSSDILSLFSSTSLPAGTSSYSS